MPHQHHDTAAILSGLERFIKDAIKRNIPKRWRADVLQDCYVHLLENCFARHDPERGEISPFLATCAENYVIDRGRQIRKQDQCEHSTEKQNPIAPDQSADRNIEELAQLILNDPDQHLSAAKARLLRAVVEHPHLPCGKIAEMLGLDLTYVWSALSRLRGEITELYARSA